MHRARHGEWCRASMSSPSSPCVCQPEKLSIPCPFGVFWRLHSQAGLSNSLVIGKWTDCQLLFPPQVGKFQPLITRLVFSASSPQPQVRAKNYFNNTTRDTLITLIVQDGPDILGALCETRRKTKYIFLITRHDISLSHFRLLQIMFLLPEMILFPLLLG